jgi:hypothetical protein
MNTFSRNWCSKVSLRDMNLALKFARNSSHICLLSLLSFRKNRLAYTCEVIVLSCLFVLPCSFWINWTVFTKFRMNVIIGGQFNLIQFNFLQWVIRAGVAQSVLCLTTNWTTAVRSPAGAKDSSFSLCVQTGSGVHPVSYAMHTGGSFPRDVTLTIHPDLVPRSRTSRSCTSSTPPKRQHGV